MKLHISKTPEELLFSLASYFVKIAHEAIQKNGLCNISLVGGNSPKKLYELLTTDAFRNKVDWTKIYFFFGDERYVPSDNPQYNALMIQKALFEPLKIAESQIFRIDTTLSPDECAKKYAKTLNLHFNKKTVRFDLMLLGLGDNAHTASLFPFTDVLNETKATVKAVFVKELNATRITMTAPMINKSKNIAFLVFGLEKAEAVKHILTGVRNIGKYPAKLIKPTKGKLNWFLDEAAASSIKN